MNLPLLLLIYFVGLPVMCNGEVHDVDVPVPRKTNFSERSKIEVCVTIEGNLTLHGVVFSNEQLAVILVELNALKPDIVVRIRAHKDVGFKAVNSVVDLALKSGIIDFLIVREEDPEKAEQSVPPKSDRAGG